ncbi:MAG: AI-2E family transporter [Candidatus Limnocylindria bacterium]
MNDRPPLQRWWPTYLLVGAGAFVAAAAALGALATLLTPLRHVLLLLLFAIVIAFVLAPLANLLERLLRLRALAIVLTFLVALGAVIALVSIVGTPLVREGFALADRAPEYFQRLSSPEPLVVGGLEVPAELKQRIGSTIAERGGEFAEQAAIIALRVATAVVDIVIVLVLAIYLLAAARRLRVGVLTLLPTRYRIRAKHAEDRVTRIFGNYVRGQLFLALVIGTLNFAALSALGLPYSLFLGVFAGVMELIPIVGPIVAGAAAALVALAQPEPFPLVLWVIIAATLIQQLENHLLVPRISGFAVGIHPLAALVAVLTGIELAGIIGGIFAVPVAGLIWVFAREYLVERRRVADEAALAAGRAREERARRPPA